MAFIPTRSPQPTPAAPTSLFPTYLLPSIPFRRRHSSNSSITTSSSPSSSPPGPSILGAASPPPSSSSPPRYLHGHKSHLRCARCSTDLALTSQIISKGFTGRHGRAYLVSGSPVASAIAATPYAAGEPALPNTQLRKPVPRQLVTGAHTVSDVSCLFCGSVLGWQYVAAEEESQRYKVGKFILETKKVVACSTWESDGDDADMARHTPPRELDGKMRGGAGAEDVEFDSQDEDECEDLFAGVWSPALAERRRRGRRFHRMGDSGSGAGAERARSEDF